jgi:hypothetical protein
MRSSRYSPARAHRSAVTWAPAKASLEPTSDDETLRTTGQTSRDLADRENMMIDNKWTRALDCLRGDSCYGRIRPPVYRLPHA